VKFPFVRIEEQAPEGVKAGTAFERSPDADGASFPPILEWEGIKVTETFDDEKKIDNNSQKEIFKRAIACACKSMLCIDCRLQRGIKIREALLARASIFKEPRLFTITVNREWFERPLAAYEWVMEEKFISRLLTTKLGVRRWVWVLEAQEESGDGWPHWHILIDVSDLPGRWFNLESKEVQAAEPQDKQGWHFIKHYFDLNLAHHFLRRWKIGEQCKLSSKKQDFASAEHAIKYITKYLIKAPRRGYPPWMLNRPRLRFYQPSYDVGSILSEGGQAPRKVTEDKPEKEHEHYEPKRPVERIAECRKKLIFVEYSGKQDKHLTVKPFLGEKENLLKFPGVVELNDFDFQKQRSFPVYGFTEATRLDEFMRYCCKPEISFPIRCRIKEKRLALLKQWDATAPQKATRDSPEATDALTRINQLLNTPERKEENAA